MARVDPVTQPQPLLFTVEFRRKMAVLSQAERMAWLESLAVRAREERREHPEREYPLSPQLAPRLAPQLAQEMREVARGCRLSLVDSIQRHLGPFDDRLLQAVLEVPRELFVRHEDLERSADDMPLPLDDQGLATISAPHAYLLSFRLLELRPGDALVELGTGSGYGAALAAFIVGPQGRVRSFEIDGQLVRWAQRNLAEAHVPSVVVSECDAIDGAARWAGADRVVVTFAVEELPRAWVDALPTGGRLVAPVGRREPSDQRLVMVRREGSKVVRTEHGSVRYVMNRSGR